MLNLMLDNIRINSKGSVDTKVTIQQNFPVSNISIEKQAASHIDCMPIKPLQASVVDDKYTNLNLLT